VPLSPNFRRLFEDEPLPLMREQYLACGGVGTVMTDFSEIQEAGAAPPSSAVFGSSLISTRRIQVSLIDWMTGRA